MGKDILVRMVAVELKMMYSYETNSSASHPQDLLEQSIEYHGLVHEQTQIQWSPQNGKKIDNPCISILMLGDRGMRLFH